MSNSIYCDALREALDVIAALPYGDTHEVDEGHEQAYRAIEQHLAKHETITPIIASETDKCYQPNPLADPRVREVTQQAYIEGFEAGLSEGRERLIRPWDAQTPVQAWETSEAANALRADLAPQPDQGIVKLVVARRIHREAVRAYNAKLEIVREARRRDDWSGNVNEEYQAMNQAHREFNAVAQRTADALGAFDNAVGQHE